MINAPSYVTDQPPAVRMPSDEMRANCLSLLLWKAQKYNVPPAHIVAHIRSKPAVRARKEVMFQMLAWGLTRGQVAMMFGRDLRRVRASVIGTPTKKQRRKHRVFHDFARFDLLGQPLRAEKESAPRVTRSALGEAWALLATLLPDHPVAAEWRERYGRFKS